MMTIQMNWIPDPHDTPVDLDEVLTEIVEFGRGEILTINPGAEGGHEITFTIDEDNLKELMYGIPWNNKTTWFYEGKEIPL